MKKFIFSLFALVGIAASASAQSVTVTDVYVKAGDTGVATLKFACTSENADKYTGMQIELTFPSADFSVAEEKAFTGWDGSLEYNQDEGSEVAKFSAAASSTFETTNISVEFTVSDAVVAGEYPVSIKGQFEGPGVADAPVEGTFKIIVTDTLTLDENSEVAPKATTAAAPIKVLRTLKANEWSTICLPFALNATNLKAAFGDDVEVAVLKSENNGYQVEKDGDQIIGLNVEFTSSSVIRANTPYIIKVSKDMTEFSTNVKIQAPTSVEQKIEVEDGETLEMVTYATMTGTYTAGTVVPKNSLFLSEGMFWYSTGLTKMKAFRVYFTFKDILSSVESAGSRIKFFVTDGDQATEIQIPELMPNDGEYYNLNGLRVETPAKGIYIKDGKKVVVK